MLSSSCVRNKVYSRRSLGGLRVRSRRDAAQLARCASAASAPEGRGAREPRNVRRPLGEERREVEQRPRSPLGCDGRSEPRAMADGRAAITGDFVLVANEVDPVLRVLRTNGIEVTALHNHMLNDEPRLFFMHFWANDDAAKLARGLRAALDRMNNQRS